MGETSDAWLDIAELKAALRERLDAMERDIAELEAAEARLQEAAADSARRISERIERERLRLDG